VPAFTSLRYEVADSIATITLDRPDALNALTVTLKQELLAALRSVAGEMGLGVGAFLRASAPLSLRIVVIGGAAAAASAWLPPSFGSALFLFVPIGALYLAAMLPLAWNGPVGPYLRMALPKGWDNSARASWFLQLLTTKPS